MITRINSFASLCMLLAVLTAMEAAAQTTLQAQSIEMAALQTHLAWQRTSPTAQHPDGPVLYQIIFRSSATRGAIPKISNTFTLTNSLMSESGSTVIINGTANMTGFQLTTGGAVGKVLTSDASGNGTWQTPAGGGGGTVTSVGLSAPGSDFSVTNSPVTGSGILTLNWITSPTSANTANAIVKRDANGNFSAAAINASSTITSLNAAVSNVAVFGRSSATSGFGIGVEGESDSASGAAGVFNNTRGGKILSLQSNGGEVVSVAGNGVVGATGNVASNSMIRGINNNASGMGISGVGNIGVYGQSGTSFSLGLSGNAAIWGDGRTGTTYGVVGTSPAGIGTGGSSDSGSGVTGISSSGAGVFGLSTGSGTAGVFNVTGGGKILSGENTGVEKFSIANDGAVITNAGLTVDNANANQGIDLTNALRFGVSSGEGISSQRCSNGGGGCAGGNQFGLDFYTLFAKRISISQGGEVDVFGNMTVLHDVQVGGSLGVLGTKNFKIDHPLAPAEKYLVHASIESSEVMDLYSGNVVLDRKGGAWVKLPDWFEALNRDFRYTLTAIGAPGPNLYIAQEIRDHRFKIAGGKPLAKVSWQVTGIRHDAYITAHPMQVEEDKGTLRGTYLAPELFGQPPSKQAIGQVHPSAVPAPKSGGQ